MTRRSQFPTPRPFPSLVQGVLDGRRRRHSEKLLARLEAEALAARIEEERATARRESGESLTRSEG
jgi:hypothetical protein